MLNLIFVLTTSCSLSCPHCLRKEGESQDLPLALFQKALQGALPYGIENLHLTGGEPFLYPHLEDVFSSAAEKGLSLTFSTNGLLLLSQETLLKKYRSSLRMLNISVESPDQNGYESIRGKGHFKNLLDSLKLCRKLQIPFLVLSCMNARNKGQLKSLVRFARSQKASGIVFSTVLPCERSHKNNMGLSETERRDLLREAEKLKSINVFDPLHFLSLPVYIGESMFASRQEILMCANQALRQLTIDVEGNLHFCCFLAGSGLESQTHDRLAFASLKDSSFEDAYGQFVRQMFAFCEGRRLDFAKTGDRNNLDFNSCFYCHQKMGL